MFLHESDIVVFQLFAKLQATKQEIQDLQEEHVKERQELEQTQNELTRELKLKYVHVSQSLIRLLIGRGYSNFLFNMAFISPSEVENIYIS